MNRILAKARREARSVSHRLRPAGRALGTLSHRVPVPARRRVSKMVLRKPWPVSVPIDTLLLGSQAGLAGAAYAEATGDLLWTSTRVIDGPHTALFRAARAAGAAGLSDADILGSAYARMARAAIDARGQYFDATDDAGIVRVARSAIARHLGGAPAAALTESTPVQPATATPPGDPILVAPVRRSAMFQVLDGHHRIAAAAVAGRTSIDVRTKWLPVDTALQQLLGRMSWIGGQPELYQPVDAPELDRWPLVRKCTDRRDKMLTFLAAEGLTGPNREPLTYLDVASCYGWFVDQMGRNGLTARGIERDPLGPVLGQAIYGLDPANISTGDAINLLDAMGDARTDVVSCFSLLHHFALGRGPVSATELLQRLDAHTGKVLFFDTGQAHEEWFAESLSEWTTDYVRTFLETNTTFARVVDLGPDDDAVPPYERNYGRHLFACVR